MIKLSTDQKNILQSIIEWTDDPDCPVAILQGSAGTGKTTLLRSVVSELERYKKTFALLAPTGRAARILGKKTGKAGRTIHSEIYEIGELKAEEQSDVIQGELDSPGFHIPFVLKEGTESRAAIYIVDESSMVSDMETYSETLSFGSGRLLHDLLHYTRIINCKNVQTKILFVGDAAQLPPVKCEESPALDTKYFLSEFKTRAKCFQLHQVFRQKNGSLLLENATKFRNSISSNRFGSFDIAEDGKTVVNQTATQVVKAHSSEMMSGDSVIITVSNKNAFSFNMAFRKQKFNDSKIELQQDDILLVCRNSASTKFFNGDVLTVIKADDYLERRSIRIAGSNKTVDLLFRTVLVKSIDDEGEDRNVQCKILENLLFKPDPTLSMLETRALIADFRMRHKDVPINSDEFKKKLLEDEYFNALVVKFGYAITCHKAQGGEWNNVSVDFTDFPNRGSGFFRWAYTAITRCQTNLGVINPPRFQDASEADLDIQCASLAPDYSGDPLQDSPFLPSSESVANLEEIVIENSRGKRWSEQEDAQLISEFKENRQVKEMAKAHGRTRGAITSRLFKLGLIEKLNIASKQDKLSLESDHKPESQDNKVGTWSKAELNRLRGLWELSNKNKKSVASISQELGRSQLSAIIQLYKAGLVSLEYGDELCNQCQCPYLLSNSIKAY